MYIPPEFEDFVVNVIGAPIEATADIFFCSSQLDCFTPVDTAGRTVFEGDHPTPHLNFADYAGFMDREVHNLTADFVWEMENGVEFTSITNWSNVDKFYTEDGDGIPIPIIEFTTISDFTQISQELRWAWDTDKTSWQVGAYYLDIDMDGDVITRGAPVAGAAFELGFDPALLTDPAIVQDYHLDSRNWSVFAQGEFDLTDTVTLIAGGRWSQDDKEFDFVISLVRDDVKELSLGDKNDIKIRSWFRWAWLPFFRYFAWYPPILVINGKLISQGIVPRREQIIDAMV